MLERDTEFHSEIIIGDEMRLMGMMQKPNNSFSGRVHHVRVPERQNKFAPM
jgi:hypothetical protein